LGNVDCIAYRDNPTGTDGFHLLIPSNRVESIWSNFVESSGDRGTPGKRFLRPVGWAAFNSCRIEAGRALFGVDFGGVPAATAYPVKKLREAAESEESGPGVLPAETGALFYRAIDLAKCYIGQEVVARMHARQVFARQIVGFRMTDDALPLAGATVHDSAGNHIGIVTSSTVSPMLSNTAIGLAFVKKPFFAVGSKLTVPAEGALREATVTELPFLKQ
jgi:aminomethyltransferase